jgi:hypothetical protein
LRNKYPNAARLGMAICLPKRRRFRLTSPNEIRRHHTGENLQNAVKLAIRQSRSQSSQLPHVSTIAATSTRKRLRHPTVQELLVTRFSTTMIYTHVLNKPGPLDEERRARNHSISS